MSRPTIQFGGQPMGFPVRRIAALVPIVLLAIGLLTTYYSVPADATGVVLRFGKFHTLQDPGLHFKLPFGIDEVELVPVKRQLKLEFGFMPLDTPTNPDQASESPEMERSMVTGDTSSAMVEWIVQYHVEDPKLYLFHVRKPASTLRDLSEAVMREVIGDRTVEEVITTGRQEIETVALLRLRELAAAYQLGTGIDLLQLKNVNPPREVQTSFNEVNKAQQDRENMINIANGEYNKVVPKATGEAEQKISNAEGYRLKRVNEALGDVLAFNSVLAEYLKAPEVTRTRIYLETMKDVLPQMQNTWIVDERVTQLLPMLQTGAATKEVQK
ncbi:MAG: FtsH protease activity modulator HflK [Planctomycetes bacterium]|nr:FtsH protease activity modulator HflK [Planctomycetota bacterium]